MKTEQNTIEDIKLYYNQIIKLLDLMLETCDDEFKPNIEILKNSAIEKLEFITNKYIIHHI